MSRRGSIVHPFRILAVLLGVVCLSAFLTVPASAKSKVASIVLPDASSAEGIAAGSGSVFYAGDLFAGDIFRGDVQKGTAEKFIDAPDGRMAGGMNYDAETGYLFVAGLFTGQGYVYDTAARTTVAVYQFADPSTNPIINDVTLTPAGAWFTNSSAPVLYFVPLVDGVPGAFSTLSLSGPAANLTGQFNNNGIVSSPDGATLITAHSADGALYKVNPVTGASSAVSGVSVPNVDGIVVRGHSLWAVQNFSNQVSQFRLGRGWDSGTLVDVITSSLFEIPTTAIVKGNQLAVVNAKFDTGFPPTADQYDITIVRN